MEINNVAHTGMIYPFDPSRLGPASYEMVLGGEYLYWNEDGKKNSSKKYKIDEKLSLRKNSITYVSVEETFRIPDYIALRFNLRVKHVHRGLLLGTGPLIDPGFHGNLMIPIHNLTNNEYQIKPGEKLISVEFTKLSPNPIWLKTAEDGTEEDIIERQGHYVQNSGKNSKKSFSRLLKNTLPSGIAKVMSSLAGTLAEANSQIKSISRYKNIAIGATIVGVLAFIAVFISVINLVADANKYVSDAAMVVKKYEDEDTGIRNSVVRDEMESLKEQLAQLSEEIRIYKKQNSKTKGKELRVIEKLNSELKRLREEVDELKHRLRSNGKNNT